MKKFLVLVGILFLVFCGFIVYDTYGVIPMLDIEEDRITIEKLYVYGTHLNMEGNCSFIDNMELVLYDGEFISYDINDLGVREDEYDKLIDSSYMGDFDRRFNLSDYVNDGIYLDDIPDGDYYLFFRVKYMDGEEEKYRYYGIDNESGYEDTTYYTMSNYNKKIVIDSEDKYPTMMMHVDKNEDDNIYDIVIDPGHGGIDGGANKNGYKETDFSMNIATKVKDKLEKYGFKVKLTHDKGQLKDDERLEEYGKGGRAVISSEVKAKYLFSLHLNSSSSSKVNGLEVYTAKNINYDFAKMLVNNITSLTGVGYSSNRINKIDNSIYSRNFTKSEVDRTIKNYEDEDLIPYDVTTNSNYYYMIRETGGIVTGAYVDNRNSKIIGNPYTNSNVGTEAYLLELGYLSNEKDLNIMINSLDKYVDAIVTSIKSLYDNNVN